MAKISTTIKLVVALTYLRVGDNKIFLRSYKKEYEYDTRINKIPNNIYRNYMYVKLLEHTYVSY